MNELLKEVHSKVVTLAATNVAKHFVLFFQACDSSSSNSSSNTTSISGSVSETETASSPNLTTELPVTPSSNLTTVLPVTTGEPTTPMSSNGRSSDEMASDLSTQIVLPELLSAAEITPSYVKSRNR